MKVAAESQASPEVWIKPLEFTLLKGLIGFEDLRRFELLISPEEQPFMWIRAADRPELGFVVVEPGQIVADYQIEISDDDARALGVEDPQDALVLNIVSFGEGQSPAAATVNLVGPVVLNRRSAIGQQLVVANHHQFSSRHPILATSA